MKGNQQPKNLLDLVDEFLQLQDTLLGEIFRLLGGPLVRESLGQWPLNGRVFSGRAEWTFSRHGLGYTFTEVGGPRIVEAHRGVDKIPSPFDAFRIGVFAESLGFSFVSIAERAFPVDEESLHKALNLLVDSGMLRRVDSAAALRSSPLFSRSKTQKS